jgi:hypothetical protein
LETKSTTPAQHPWTRAFFGPDGRPRASWRLLLFAFLYVAFLYGVGWPLALLCRTLFGAFSPSLNASTLAVSVVVGAVVVLLATTVLLMIVEHRGFPFVGLGLQRPWGGELLLGFAGGVGMIALIVLLEAGSGHLRLMAGAGPRQGAAWLLFAFVLFAVGALHEELLFRGYAFQRMIDVLGAPAAILLLSVLFGGVHWWNPNTSRVGVANTVLVGILFGLAYVRTRGLWLPIGLHWGWNLAEAGFGLPVSGITIGEMPLRAEFQGQTLFHGGRYGPEASIFATLVIAVVTASLLWWKPSAPPRESKEVT